MSSSRRPWMYNRMNRGILNRNFIAGVEDFLNYCVTNPNVQKIDGMIRCPCKRCANTRFLPVDEVKYHLYSKGFVSLYERWTCHGEKHEWRSTFYPSKDRKIEMQMSQNRSSKATKQQILDAVKRVKEKRQAQQCEVAPTDGLALVATSTVDTRIKITVQQDGSVCWPQETLNVLRDIFRSCLTPEGSMWMKVPMETKLWYAEEMKYAISLQKYFTWDSDDEGKVMLEYIKTAQDVYNKWLYEIRKEHNKEVAKLIDPEILTKWRRVWDSEDAKKNRRRGDLDATHTGGHRSFCETAKKMRLDEDGTYACPKTSEIAQDPNSIGEDVMQQGITEYDRDAIFGLRALAATVPIGRSSFSSDGRILESADVEQRFQKMETRFEDRIQQVDDRVTRIEQYLETITNQNRSIIEELRRR
ncbi:uncharacterized protein LOC127264449 isoform X2 [Andrographis paniculata]|uniref:uncharacterized protein LOC127264449 isoform X2 n=1 Tax=Andrographis paniculata TaxID=175694 RepID=UPI0021E90FE3|nr:uncharacterized protein LOC127264449 isoform X2 [Andrographis paniculata]